MPKSALFPPIGGGEDFLLRPEAGGDIGNGDEGGGADGEGQSGDRHLLEQAAHFPDVLFVVAGVDDRAGTEEEQSLEPGVGEKVEHAGFTSDEAHGHDHVAELREGGVGEDLLDVVLLGGHQRGGERGNAADPGDDGAGEKAVEDFGGGRGKAARGRACKRRRRPSSRRGSARKPESDLPWRLAARRAAEAARIFRPLRRRCRAGRWRAWW